MWYKYRPLRYHTASILVQEENCYFKATFYLLEFEKPAIIFNDYLTGILVETHVQCVWGVQFPL